MFILAGSDQIFQFECRRAQSFPESLQHIQKMALPMAKEQKKKDDFFKTMISFDQKDITESSDIERKGMITMIIMIIMILVSVISLVVNLERDHPLLLLGLTVRHPLLSDLSCHAHRPESNLGKHVH